MPFPRTWSEELIAEWLQLEGYFVEVGVPIVAGAKGGRNEADIIGTKIEDDRLKIFHIEVGSLSGNPKDNAERIKDKFSEQKIKSIEAYCKNKLNFSSNQQPIYEKLYIAVWVSDKTLSYLKQLQLPVIPLMEFINNRLSMD